MLNAGSRHIHVYLSYLSGNLKPSSHISAMVGDEGFATSATGLRYMRTPMNYIGDGRRSSAIKSQKTK